jgi:hypothetical protein
MASVGGELFGVEVAVGEVGFPSTVIVGSSLKPVLRVEEETTDRILGLDRDGDGQWWRSMVSGGGDGVEERRVREGSKQ